MPLKGFKQSEDHIQKKIPNKGKFGVSHPKWKGGFSNKIHSRKLRLAVLECLGGACNICGFSDKRALQIDHINGGGSKERKERNFKGTFHKHVMESFLKGENKYQLLCANCNWIKRFEKQEL